MLFSLSVLVCMLYWLVNRRARSSAKSRSSSWENRVHWMSLGLSAVVLVVIQSMATRKRIGEMMHPCLTPDCTENHSERVARATPNLEDQVLPFVSLLTQDQSGMIEPAVGSLQHSSQDHRSTQASPPRQGHSTQRGGHLYIPISICVCIDMYL
ncbi:unnamed protein product [Arctogadus glacialis]